MSWLNNSLNTLKGQLTTLAQEVLAETAGPGDDEYRGPQVDTKTALELLADSEKQKEDLDILCSEKDNQIALLRKQITELENQKISDISGGSDAATSALTAKSTGNSKNATASNLEDSWCWEPDNIVAKNENDPSSSDASSGNGNEMVNITLEEARLGGGVEMSARPVERSVGHQTQRIQQLEEENKQLNASLEELDSQHNLAMQNVLEVKASLQEKLAAVTRDYETLKQEHTDKFINSELEMAKLRKQLEELITDHRSVVESRDAMQKKLKEYEKEMKNATEEMADLQALLDKKSQDNVELIERVKAAGEVTDRADEERAGLSQRVEELLKEIDELKKAKEKKTSESSTSSVGKQSEDEFIVVREGGEGSSSDPTTPPTKEKLRDKLVQLENRISELTLENGSLALKLRDIEMEKELASNVLKENLQVMQQKFDELTEKLRLAEEQKEEEQEKINEWREKASEAVIAHEQVKALTSDREKLQREIAEINEKLKASSELEKRLLLSEQEKENLQLELQALRSSHSQLMELESKLQNLTLANQQLKLNQEAEKESLDNSAELEEKLKGVTEENESLRSELESVAHAKFRQAIAEEKQEITDLDADEDDAFSMEKLRQLLETYAKSDLSEGGDALVDKTFKALRDRLWKIDKLEKDLSRMSEDLLDLQDSKMVWDHEKKTLEADISQYVLQCDELMKNNEILLNELENYKRNKLETIHENHNEENLSQLEAQLEECSRLNRSLESEYAELHKKLEEIDREKQQLTEELRASQQEAEKLRAQDADRAVQIDSLQMERDKLLAEMGDQKAIVTRVDSCQQELLSAAQEQCESLESQLRRLSKDHADLVAAMQAQKNSLMEACRKREEMEKSLEEKEKSIDEMKKELLAKDIVADSLKNEIKVMQEQMLQLEAALQSKETLEDELAEMYRQLEAKSVSEQKLLLDLKAFEDLKQSKTSLEREYQALEAELEMLRTQKVESKEATTLASDAESIARIAQLEADLLASSDLQKAVETLKYEQGELMKALQQKHAENAQYCDEVKQLSEALHQAQVQLETARKTCNKCPNLEVEIDRMRKLEEQLKDQVNFLKEKSDILTTNLLSEQTNQKLLRQEKSEAEEQNAAIHKDLERLRAHLLEIEDMHTQETIEMQRELEATKAKMLAMQEEVTKSSTAYTSASIRANQQAETLQAQYALLVQQRDELVAKLSLAEDRESKNQAALCNLQCALEQFQNDKENDIKAATQRIRKELQAELDREQLLRQEVASLQTKLNEANQGLGAAARLSDKLEECQQTIAVLREEVDTLKRQNGSLVDKLNANESNQADKIEKSLIKSLLIGYVVSSNPNDKSQVLRMISSVLDFTQSESDRVGLNKQQSSWLGSLLGSGGGQQGVDSNENLVQAFVQFLEKESQPKVNQNEMPNLLNITQSSSAATISTTTAASGPSRRTSVASNSGSGSGSGGPNLTPLPVPLLNSTVLDEFAPSRNSSSILKDILSDS